MKRFYSATLFCCTAFLFALDQGGVSIDFSKKVKPDADGTSVQYVPGGQFNTKEDFGKWNPGHWVHIGASDGDYVQLLKDVEPYIHQEWKDQAACLRTDKELHGMKNNRGSGLTVSNRLGQRFPAKPGNLVLSWSASGKHDKGPAYSGFLVQLSFYNAEGKKTGETYSQYPTLAAGKKEYKLSGIAPADTTEAEVLFCFYGVGNIVLDDIALTPQKVVTGISAKLNPHGFLDNVFCLPEKTPFTVHFGLRNVSGEKEGEAAFFIELPDGFDVLAARVGNSLVKVSEHCWKVDLTGLRRNAPFGSYSATYPTVNLMLLANALNASEKLYPAKYWVEEPGKKGTVETFSLKILPFVSAAQPVRFRSGFCPMNDFTYSNADSEHLEKLLKATGFNSGLYIPGGLVPVMRRLGMELSAEAIANGYRIGPNPKPDYALFRGADGKPFLNPGTIQNICPTEVYTRGEYYKNSVIPYFESIMNQGYTNLMANWEPFAFDRRGCFCDRCKAEFVKYSKLPEAEVAKLWGPALLEKYGDLWTKFRSWQHGRLVATVNQTMNELGKKRNGKESYFIPAISYTLFTAPENHSEYAAEDYIDSLQWVEPWGPYVYYRYSEPYLENCGWNIVTWLAAKKIKQMIIQRQSDVAKRTKLIAFPHAYQGSDWVTEPETLAFETLLFFVSGYEGSYAYTFPLGYDYRYWKALTEANRTISALEPYFFDGKDVSGQVSTEPVTPLPHPNPPAAVACWSSAEGLGTVEKASLLQQTAVEWNGKMLAALGDFWKGGEVFCTFRAKGLSRGPYTVTDPIEHVSFGTFSAEELEKGILMQVGAMRWRFLLIEKNGKTEEKTVSQADLKAMMQKRLPEIRRNFEKEQTVQSAKFTADNDYSKLKAFSSQGITVKPVRKDGKDFLRVESSAYTLDVDAEHGGSILDWKTRSGQELSGPTGTLGLCVDSFMDPKVQNWNEAWQIAGIREDLEGVTLTLKYRIPEQTDPAYGGLDFLKTCQFIPEGFRVKLEVRNAGGKTIRFVYRAQNQTGFFTTKNGEPGMLRTGTTELKRDGVCHIIRVGKSEPKVMKLYPVKELLSSGGKSVEFSAPWGDTALKFQTNGKVGFYAVWDDIPERMKYATAEILFEETKLAPGAKETFSFTWTFNKK